MVFKASILLLIFLSTTPNAVHANTVEAELNDSVQKKDWPSLILLLQPLQGQNFEHDLVLARALISLERRQEALKLLGELVIAHKDERAQKLYHLAGTLFFSQDTSTLYYEAVQLLSASKFAEAKERLDQAAAKEPGQVMVLARLVEVEMLLGQKEAARNHLKLAQARTLLFPELKIYSAKMDLDAPQEKDEESEDFVRQLLPLKASLLDNEVTLTFWAEALKRTKRSQELALLGQKTLKEHPTWSYALAWFYKNGEGTLVSPAQYKTEIDKNLKDSAGFDSRLEKEMKRTQYLWMGYSSRESITLLLHQVQGAGTSSTN